MAFWEFSDLDKIWEFWGKRIGKFGKMWEIKGNFGRNLDFRNLGLDFEKNWEFLGILEVGKIWVEISGKKSG